MIACRGREGKQVAPSVPKDDASTKRRFYALRSRVEKLDEKESDDDFSKFSFFYFRYEFLLSGGVWFVDGIEVLEIVACA